jgi:hypothetical protein
MLQFRIFGYPFYTRKTAETEAVTRENLGLYKAASQAQEEDLGDNPNGDGIALGDKAADSPIGDCLPLLLLAGLCYGLFVWRRELKRKAVTG